jgi:neurocalcin delta
MLGTNVDAENMTPVKRTEEIFDKMDINKDGVLTKEEFINGCMADKQLYSILLADEAPDDVGEE